MSIPKSKEIEQYYGHNFSPLYKEKCFLQWYKLGRASARTLKKHLEPDELGKTPGFTTIQKWSSEEKWNDRADELDRVAARTYEKEIVEDRIKMLKTHEKIAVEFRDKAVEALRDMDLETPHQAIRMLQYSIDLERASVGIPDIIAKVAEMGDEELTDKITRFLKNTEVQYEMLEAEDESD